MNDTISRPPSRQVFRESVLRRHASPENLDRLLTVTTPLGWLALGGVILILGLVVAWSILGRLPTIVSGEGILLTNGEVWTVTSPANGKIAELLVHVGHHVNPGEVVAEIEQPDLVIAVKQAQEDLIDLQAEQKKLLAFDQEARDRREQNWTERDSALRAQITRLQTDVSGYATLVSNSRTLLTKGFETSRDTITVQATLSGIMQQLAEARLQLLTIDTERVSFEEEQHRKEFDLQTRIDSTSDLLTAKTAELNEKSKVVSRYEGRIVERLTEPGRYAQLGDNLFKLEPTVAAELNKIGVNAGDPHKIYPRQLAALIYLPAGAGKRVAPGMTVRLATESYNKEEYGYITGKVTEISNIPQTAEQMRMYLENKTLVEEMMRSGAPLQAVVALDLDPDTPSGLHWSSSQGPGQRISQGTLVQGEVVTEYRRPIALAIPLLKSLLGV
jgi:HlyD family secretion protein